MLGILLLIKISMSDPSSILLNNSRIPSKSLNPLNKTTALISPLTLTTIYIIFTPT